MEWRIVLKVDIFMYFLIREVSVYLQCEEFY